MTMSLKGQKATQQRHRKEETTLKGKKEAKASARCEGREGKKKKTLLLPLFFGNE